MSTPRATGAVLRGAIAVTAGGVSRLAPAVAGTRFAARAPRGAVDVDLRDHATLPGLINAHDHLQQNCVPPLPGGAVFPNSYAWIDAFQAHFEHADVKAALAVPKEVRLRHGALKNLLAGTTCVAHHDPWHAALDAPDFPVALLRGAGWSYALGHGSYGPPVRESFDATPADRPWVIHLAEGSDAVARAELDALDQLGCLAANSVLVHGVGLGEEHMARVIERGAAVVWCPASNRNLLGTTLDPRRLAAAGRLALGSDSRLSGARDLLDELCGVRERDELPAPSALSLVTEAAARILRLDGHGTLDAGKGADFIVVADRAKSASAALEGVRRADLRAVVRGGKPCIADPDLGYWFAAVGVPTVAVTLDGRPKLVDARLAEPALMALEPGFELARRVH
ncbi:amidohydrolase family protein [Luteibacter yeojuensis]|uniref:Amidohydrolase n=1 Tax=Luteibacter yeojuensis TaxID=345309 RepID=A0A0F3L0S0_9GAMM|nr:amidohydrolase family protein [Luteibacter yeojuensis]KJV36812.1 amidohydrolase [Luteibacter yeojuensis]